MSKIVILSGPSGVGKDTVLDQWRRRNPHIQRVIAVTTRAPRPGEIDGVDYQFMTRPAFEEMVEANGFLEHMPVLGEFYGTPFSGIESILASGCVPVLKIDVKGAVEAMEKLEAPITIMLTPPSMEELARRLRGRDTETDEQFQERMRVAVEELSYAPKYQYSIVNENVEKTVDQLEKIVFG